MSVRAANAELAAECLRAAAVHLAAARLQASYVARLQETLKRPGTAAAGQMSIREVARTLNASAAVSVNGRATVAALGLASDVLASGFQDAEMVMGEGPTFDAVNTGELVAANHRALFERWPQLAPAVTGMGVRKVASVPMRHRAHAVGELAVLNPGWSAANGGLSSLQEVADWLAETVADQLESHAGEATTVLAPLLRDDRLRLLHQAAGRVAADVHCDVDAALALIRAHSFAESIDLSVLADDTVAGRCRLDG